jgi:peptidoglycan/LPS O-acetylase OafA/YrhL
MAPLRAFLPHVEGLRAVAVLLVMLYHAGMGFLPGGFIGVDVFFVISGFLITGLLVAELDESGRLDLTRFFARRVRRLLPAATVVLVATLTAAWLIVPPLRWRTVAIDGLASALWSGNIRFALTQYDYLTANDAPSPFLHFWSLGVEEQFYLFWPVILSLSFALLWRWFSARATVAIVASLTLAVSFLTSLNLSGSQQPFAFFLLPARAWELAAGALLAAVFPFVERMYHHLRNAVGVLGLLVITTCAVLYDSTLRWPGFAAVLPVVATLAILVSTGLSAWLLSLRPLLAIGRWSYSLYLWHWPVLVLAPIALGRPLTVIEALLALMVSSFCAVICYRLVENPLRSHRLLVSTAWRSFALGCALMVASSVTATALTIAPLPRAPVTATTAASGVPLDKEISFEQLLTASDTVSSVPADLTPALRDAEDDRFSIDLGDCFASNLDDTAPVGGCYFGDLGSTRTIALIGDSHAAQWTAALLEIARNEGFRLLILAKSACPPVQLLRSSATLGSFPECRRWNTSVMERLRADRPDITLLAGYSGYAIERRLDPYDHRLSAWGKTLDQLAAFTKPILIADTPYPDHDVPVCLSANMDNPGACIRSRDAMTNALPGRSAELDAARSRRVPVVETFDLVCPTPQCPVIVGNILVYRDESHISAAFARWLARPLAAKLSMFSV